MITYAAFWLIVSTYHGAVMMPYSSMPACQEAMRQFNQSSVGGSSVCITGDREPNCPVYFKNELGFQPTAKEVKQ